jgi:hypothetical protein
MVLNVKNPPKHKLAQGDITNFSMEVSADSLNFRFRLPALHIQNLSNRCRHNRVTKVLADHGFEFSG